MVGQQLARTPTKDVTRLSDKATALVAAICAGAMIANQVAGKAARDAIFLSNFPVTDLPTMLVVAAVASIASVLLVSQIMTRIGPRLFVSAAFALSASVLLAEWVIFQYSGQAAAVALYLHIAALGATLISGFWSLVNERFDPRTAKKVIGRIAAGASVGGLVGGLLAERVAATWSVEVMFPVLAALHLSCAFLTRLLKAPRRAPRIGKAGQPKPAKQESGPRILLQSPYLRNTALLVLLGTAAAGLIDYVFKAAAAAAYAEGGELMRFFAVFYTAIALVTLLVQSTLTSKVLTKIAPTRAVACVPLAITAGGVGALLVPGLGAMIAARGGEAVVRSSLFRSAYELLYTPVPRREKRSAKALIDVGFDRAGDVLGAGLTRATLAVAPLMAKPILLATAAILGVAVLLIVRRLHVGYVRALEKSLLARGRELDLDDDVDASPHSTLLRTLGTMELGLAIDRLTPPDTGESPSSLTVPPQTKQKEPTKRATDPIIEQVAALRSRDLARLLPALNKQPLTAAHIPHLIPLLAWDEVSDEVVNALRRTTPHCTGQLLDALLDPDEEFAIRRRLPRVLAACDSHRAVAGLFEALSDKRFEVRFQCGRALARILGAHDALTVNSGEVYRAVQREVAVDRRVWESRRLLDRVDPIPDSVVGEFLRKRSNRGVEHVFTLLSLVLPRKPLRIAFQGLHTDDKVLRGTALEYLESVLPTPIRDSLWPILDPNKGDKAPNKSREEVLEHLLRSSDSIAMNLAALREKIRAAQSDEGGPH